MKDRYVKEVDLKNKILLKLQKYCTSVNKFSNLSFHVVRMASSGLKAFNKINVLLTQMIFATASGFLSKTRSVTVNLKSQ